MTGYVGEPVVVCASKPDEEEFRFVDDPRQPFRPAAPLLEQWRLRQVTSPPEQPEPGSALAADDGVFPQFPVSEVARLSLISSGEHLRLLIDGLERDNLYSTAQHTALRGALVGAVQAVWILHPDDPAERRERGLRAVAYGYDELRKYHEKTLQIQDLLGLDDSEHAQVDDQIAWIRHRESSVSNARKSRKMSIARVLIGIASVASTGCCQATDPS